MEFKITIKKENKSISRTVDLSNEKKTIDEIYKMASILENKIYAEEVRISDNTNYLRDKL